MAHLHLFTKRFTEVAENYLQRVHWICDGIVPEIASLVQAIESNGAKQHFTSPKTLVFDGVESHRDILRFFKPIQCCGKTLWNSEMLMLHIMQQHDAGQDEFDSGTKRLAILFNLYVQIGTGILQRYDNNYDMIEQSTVQLLRKVVEYLSCILLKPIRRDGSAADTFHPNVTFAKWKYVFDYTCRTCVNCRPIEGAIAWFILHQNTMKVNPIRHVGTVMHSANLRNCLPDCVVPPPAAAQPRDVKLSNAAKYLLDVRESELDKLCTIGTAVQQNTPYEAVNDYLTEKLGAILKKMVIEPFGSRVTGVATPESDLDLVIRSETNMKPKTAYYKVLGWATENRNEVEVSRQIPAGPLVLQLDVFPLKTKLDLTFDSPYVVGNGKLVEYFFRLQPMARKLFFLLKEWKQRTDISENFHHNVLTSMIMFYMQTEQYFPPIASLINGGQKIDGLYNTKFDQRITLYAVPVDFLALVKGFFTYWARFDWTRNGVSVNDAEVHPKGSFQKPTTATTTPRKTEPPMMIGDYFDVTRNVAGNVQSGDHQKFVQGCQDAVDVLKAKRTI